MLDRIYPKRSYPEKSFCGHRYWKYIKSGDDAEKECFCDLDGEFCFGKAVCEKRKGVDDDI